MHGRPASKLTIPIFYRDKLYIKRSRNIFGERVTELFNLINKTLGLDLVCFR